LRRNLLQFLAVQIVRPLGLLVQFAILARIGTPDEYGRFMALYAGAIVLSVLSDLGQRQLAFSAMRSSSPERLGDAASSAFQIKLTGSLVMLVFCFATTGFVFADISTALAVWLVAATAPIADTSASLLRGLKKPGTEIILAVMEQAALILVFLLAEPLFGETNPTSWLFAMGILGAGRSLLLHIKARKEVGGIVVLRRKPDTRYVLTSMATAISILAAVGMARLPGVYFSEFMEGGSFAVFVSFWALFQRSELLMSAVIQTAYRQVDTRLGRFVDSTRHVALAGAGLGLALFAVAFLLAPAITRIFLGAKYVPFSDYSIAAAGLLVAHLPAFGLRTVLQYRHRSRPVTVIYFLAIVVTVVAMQLLILDGMGVVLPYAVALMLATLALIYVGSNDRTR